MEQRSGANEEKRNIALRTKGQVLLSGNVYCAHCGGRLTTIRYRNKYTRTDGSVYELDRLKYFCYHKSRKLCECDGQIPYRVDVVDEKMNMVIRRIFGNMEGAPDEEKLEELFKKKVAGNRARQKKLNFELGKSQTQLEKLQMEIVNSLTGDSVYSAENLSQAIATIKAKVRELNDQLAKLKEEEMKERQGKDMVSPAYRQFKSWAEEYDEASLEQKKMIFCGLFNRIEVGRDYKISVELNMSYRQFCSAWSNAGEMDGMIAI